LTSYVITLTATPFDANIITQDTFLVHLINDYTHSLEYIIKQWFENEISTD